MWLRKHKKWLHHPKKWFHKLKNVYVTTFEIHGSPGIQEKGCFKFLVRSSKIFGEPSKVFWQKFRGFQFSENFPSISFFGKHVYVTTFSYRVKYYFKYYNITSIGMQFFVLQKVEKCGYINIKCGFINQKSSYINIQKVVS